MPVVAGLLLAALAAAAPPVAADPAPAWTVGAANGTTDWESMEVKPWDHSTWSPKHFIMWGVFMELMFAFAGMFAVYVVGPLLISLGFGSWEAIPARGKLHVIPSPLQGKDWWYMAFNKAWIPAFTYHTIRYIWHSENITHGLEEISLKNTALTIPMLFIVYDFFYSFFHRALHHRSAYAAVHKHHHQQMVPTNGIEDAINEHPFEYLIGEYMHLIAIAIVSNLVTLHLASILVFASGAGFLPALNHTRMDVAIPGFYRSKHHDQHHVIPTCNYGNYTMFWDVIVGTYIAHPSLRDRVE